ncbi:MAG: MFS transporter, partial [Proteobacteria bacterium]|nr:MFS transporter [Pseudomonadota bacterium]
FGVAMMSVFGLLRGFFGEQFNIVLLSTFFIALAQPLIINSITTMTARWFPVDERITANGLTMLSQLLGILGGMAFTPILVGMIGIRNTLILYGGFVTLVCLIFLLFYREGPLKQHLGPEEGEEFLQFSEGLKSFFRTYDGILLLIVFCIGFSAFNTISTWIEQILAPKGYAAIQAGMIGGAIIAGGIIGCIILPLISDKTGKRSIFLMIRASIQITCLLGIILPTPQSIGRNDPYPDCLCGSNRNWFDHDNLVRGFTFGHHSFGRQAIITNAKMNRWRRYLLLMVFFNNETEA